jgi:hypothetical protein
MLLSSSISRCYTPDRVKEVISMPRPNTYIDLRGIASVLSGTKLEVPVYQRPFEWTSEVKEMLDDIGEAFLLNQDDYFLGSLVIIAPNEGERFRVLDGQQRLAVTALLLAGMADEFETRSDTKRAEAIRNQFLVKFDIGSGVENPQLKLNYIDDPYFRLLMQGQAQEPGKEAPDSHRYLWGARKTISDWISVKLKEEANPIKWLSGFTYYLEESAYVVYFIVPDDANAFLIFETMNDRGLELSIADLLKNYLLGHAGHDIQNVLNMWTGALSSLSAYGGETLFSVFLRHFWSSKHGLTREKDLYRSIKSRVSTAANVMDFARDLTRNSYYYGAILSPEHEFWSESSSSARELIRTLDLLGLVQYRPMLLSALAHLQTKDLEAVLRLLISWNVRLLIVGGLGGGAMEGYYSELGRQVSTGEVKSLPEIAQSAKRFIPSDSVFREGFASARVSKVSLARYYLRALERQAAGKAQPEMIPNIDPAELTLEHILPERGADESWRHEFSEEEVKAYSVRLGNMVLLSQRTNSKIRSASFDVKRDIYEKSDLNLTKLVATYQQWNIETIENRQNDLAELALKIWKLEL